MRLHWFFPGALILLAGCEPAARVKVDHGDHNPVPEDRQIVDENSVGGGPWALGKHGGSLIVPLIGEPKSFNWIVNNDQNTSEVGRVAYAELIRVNSFTQRAEPELAKSYTVAPDNKSITVTLRRGLQWSDGEPFDMEDVLFTWRALWNPHVSTPTRDSLQVQDEAGETRFFNLDVLDDHTLRINAARPYAILDRLFSSIWILPRHEFSPIPPMPSIEAAGFVISPLGVEREIAASGDMKMYWEVWFMPELKKTGRFVEEGQDQSAENQAKLAAFKKLVEVWDKEMTLWASDFSSSWSTDIAVDPAEAEKHLCTMGAFRIGRYVTGQQTVYVPNPFYWKFDAAGVRLPYLNKLILWKVQNQDTAMVKFAAGEGDVLSPVLPTDVAALKRLEKRNGFTVHEVGPRLADNHFYCNQHRGWRTLLKVKGSDGVETDRTYFRYPGHPTISEKYYADFNVEVKEPALLARLRAADNWIPILEPSKAAVFQNADFRRALSSLTDRQAIADNIFAGLAVPLYGSLGPGYKDWFSPDLPKFPYDPDKAVEFLERAGLTKFDDKGFRLAPDGKTFSLTITTNANNEQRVQIGTLLAGNLRRAGINATVQPIDFNLMLTTKQSTFKFDCIIAGLSGGDTDQAANANVYRSSGFTHVWHPKQPAPMTAWEAEVDRLFDTVGTGAVFEERVAAMRAIETIFAEQQPYIHTVANTLFVAGRNDIGNFKPALMESNALWNDYLLFREPAVMEK